MICEICNKNYLAIRRHERTKKHIKKVKAIELKNIVINPVNTELQRIENRLINIELMLTKFFLQSTF